MTSRYAAAIAVLLFVVWAAPASAQNAAQQDPAAQQQSAEEAAQPEVERPIVTEQELLRLQDLANRLNERQKMLDERESTLNQREQELANLEAQLSEREREVKKLQTIVTTRLDEIRATEDENLGQLAQIYTSTKPKAAAEIISNMDMQKAVKLFQYMNPMTSGRILSALGKTNPEYASRLTEALTPRQVLPDNVSY